MVCDGVSCARQIKILADWAGSRGAPKAPEVSVVRRCTQTLMRPACVLVLCPVEDSVLHELSQCGLDAKLTSAASEPHRLGLFDWSLKA